MELCDERDSDVQSLLSFVEGDKEVASPTESLPWTTCYFTRR